MLPWKDTSLQTRAANKLPGLMALVCFAACAYFMFFH